MYLERIDTSIIEHLLKYLEVKRIKTILHFQNRSWISLLDILDEKFDTFIVGVVTIVELPTKKLQIRRVKWFY